MWERSHTVVRFTVNEALALMHDDGRLEHANPETRRIRSE